jgi:hypothetical protein
MDQKSKEKKRRGSGRTGAGSAKFTVNFHHDARRMNKEVLFPKSSEQDWPFIVLL